jgi:hypothetical protein
MLAVDGPAMGSWSGRYRQVTRNQLHGDQSHRSRSSDRAERGRRPRAVAPTVPSRRRRRPSCVRDPVGGHDPVAAVRRRSPARRRPQPRRNRRRSSWATRRAAGGGCGPRPPRGGGTRPRGPDVTGRRLVRYCTGSPAPGMQPPPYEGAACAARNPASPTGSTTRAWRPTASRARAVPAPPGLSSHAPSASAASRRSGDTSRDSSVPGRRRPLFRRNKVVHRRWREAQKGEAGVLT